MVEHGVAEDEVEALGLERQQLRLGAHRRTSRPSSFAFAFSASSIPGEMSVAVACEITPA